MNGHLFRRLLIVVLSLSFGACGSAPRGVISMPPPAVLLMVPVCAKPVELAQHESIWAYSMTSRLVAFSDAAEFQRAALGQGRFYVHDPNSDPHNSVTLPIPHNRLPCDISADDEPKRQPSKVQLIAGQIVPVAPLAPCQLLRRNALALFDPPAMQLRAALRDSADMPLPDGRWLAQPAHAHGRMRTPAHPDPVLSAQNDARKQAVDLAYESGHRFGLAIAGIESGLEMLTSKCSRFEEDLRENPDILEDFQKKIAKTLNDISLPPHYSEPELQGLAVGAFSRGFDAGFGTKKLQFLVLNTSATVSLLLFPNAYVALETAGAKAIRLALERARSIPIYVPAMTNGAGFFLKVPTAPPALVPAPFGNLSRAAEFGILTEAKMAKAIAGTGLQRHHLFEQRFRRAMPGDDRMKLTVAVTDAEHQQFTNEWRRLIPYGVAGPSTARREEIIAAARAIYAKYPAILKALDL